MHWVRGLLLAFIPFILLSVSEEPHHTTAFIGSPGEIDVLFTYSAYSTHSFWNKNGKRLSAYNHFRRQSYLLYGEYSFNHSNSLTFNGGYSMVKESLNGNSRGVEDIEIGWKHLLRETDRSALTLQLIGIIPPDDKKSSIRYGKYGAQGSLLYSKTFCLAERFGWYDLGIGYRYYKGFPSDQIVANGALGYDLTSCLRLIASSQLDYGLYNGKSKCNFNNIVFHPNYRLLNVKFECVVKVFSHASVSLGGYMHVWGQNVGTGGGYFCGTWFYF